MKYYEIKSRYIGIVLFSGEYESFKECVEDAVRKKTNLYGADLGWTGLEKAYLRGANLKWANLEWANLYGANLKGAYLEEVNLGRANLYRAYLEGANLKNASLWNTTGNGKEIKNIKGLDTYKVAYTSEVLQIGCENHPIKDWWGFSDDEILKMDGDKALRFWRENKEKIMRVVK